MKIVYAGLKYTNYSPKLGTSFEHNNFYKSLVNMPGIEVVYFPYEQIQELGKEKGNKKLLHVIKEEKPDLFFAFMFTDELSKETLWEIKKITKSVAWFSDDHWRLKNYSKDYAPYFTWVVTTYSKAVQEYYSRGIKNVIRSQWAANIDLYKPYKEVSGENPEVSFIGGWSKPRQKIILALQKAGVKVATYGGGWEGGRISEEEMIHLFSVSKINLGLNPAPGYWNKNSLGRIFLKRSMDRIVPDFHFVNNILAWQDRGIPQIKARHFEIPACRGFLMTGIADDIEKYYVPGKEIVVYDDIYDLVGKIQFYLKHEEERKTIANAGYKKTLESHTYGQRFNEIFEQISK